MKAIRIVPIFLFGCMSASALALTLSQSPLFVASTEPRVMLVASRDHQLSIKAYTDYTDVDSSGSLDTTYSDSINYYGYFATNKCYTYTSNSTSANNRFEPSGLVTTGHQCSGAWSGNFMNWATMTRMDILRKTFYGGYRSTDTATSGSTNGETVLERHFLPNDVHAFAKVYSPSDATPNATLKLYIPASVVGTNTAISLCNVTDTNSTTFSGLMAFPMPMPLIKVAAGSFPQWDSSESVQCQLKGGTQPTTLLGTYNARIKVCNPADSLALKEDNCKDYVHPTTNAKSSKPTGLLQKYGDVDAERRVRFGLMTGSYNKNKSGGVLRKNVGLLANNQNLNILSGTVCGNQAVDSDTTTPAPTND